MSTEKSPSFTTHSTPHSHGFSSHHTHQPHCQDHYKLYPKADRKHNYTISFDEFLNEVLHLPADWMQQYGSKISRIVNAESSFDKVYVYCQPVTQDSETHRNFPFTAHVVQATLVENGDDTYDKTLNWQLIVKLSWPSKSKLLERITTDQVREKTDDDELHHWVRMHSPPKVCHAR